MSLWATGRPLSLLAAARFLLMLALGRFLLLLAAGFLSMLAAGSRRWCAKAEKGVFAVVDRCWGGMRAVG